MFTKMIRSAKLLDIIVSIPIVEMAFSRKEILTKTFLYTDTILEHLIKVAVFKIKSTWVKETVDKLDKMNSIILKSKLSQAVTNEDIIYQLYTGPLVNTPYVERTVYELLRSPKYAKLYSPYRHKKINKSTCVQIQEAIRLLILELSKVLNSPEFDDKSVKIMLDLYSDTVKEM